MILYVTYLKKGAQRMSTIFRVLPCIIDEDIYHRSVELKKHYLYISGGISKVMAYEMCKKRHDMKLISEMTGLNINEINDAIELIDPLMHQFMKREEYDNEHPFMGNVHSHK